MKIASGQRRYGVALGPADEVAALLTGDDHQPATGVLEDRHPCPLVDHVDGGCPVGRSLFDLHLAPGTDLTPHESETATGLGVLEELLEKNGGNGPSGSAIRLRPEDAVMLGDGALLADGSLSGAKDTL